jgi:branched-chain amino acid transport system permease protein
MLTSDIVIQVLISGLLIGLVFSLVAIGLTLIYGVMDIVNFAHGEFLMLSMYIAFWMWTLWGVDPIFSIPICTAALFLLGVFIYKSLISRIMNAPMLAQIFATFGLMVFLQSAAFFLWKGDYRMISGSMFSGRVEFMGAFIGIPQMIAALGSIVTTGAVALLINFTELGRALRATADSNRLLQSSLQAVRLTEAG